MAITAHMITMMSRSSLFQPVHQHSRCGYSDWLRSRMLLLMAKIDAISGDSGKRGSARRLGQRPSGGREFGSEIAAGGLRPMLRGVRPRAAVGTCEMRWRSSLFDSVLILA